VPSAKVGDLSIEYRTHGDPADPPIILIRGLGTQLIEWPDALISGLVGAGLHVVTFDNRDAGLSSAAPEGYRLEDMAMDVVGLLDALELPRVHVFGISLGGMVAQHVAIGHPSRVSSLARLGDVLDAPAATVCRHAYAPRERPDVARRGHCAGRGEPGGLRQSRVSRVGGRAAARGGSGIRPRVSTGRRRAPDASGDRRR
jgi:pimeloyl-ACP methyl ester carboxylesterase